MDGKSSSCNTLKRFIWERRTVMLRKICSFIVPCLLTFASSNLLAKSYGINPPPVDGCVLYGHENYTGGSFQLAPNDEFVQFSSDIDNKISSVMVGKYCTLYAYSDWLFRGLSGVYETGWYPNIEPNDAMTSAKCTCEFNFDPS